MSPNLRGVFYSLMSFGIFATHDVAVKTLGGHYSPVQIIFFSLLLFRLLALILSTAAAVTQLLKRYYTRLCTHFWRTSLKLFYRHHKALQNTA